MVKAYSLKVVNPLILVEDSCQHKPAHLRKMNRDPYTDGKNRSFTMAQLIESSLTESGRGIG